MMGEYEYLDPKTPREYLEACHRIVATFEKIWDELPDGDGENGTPGDETKNKTDMFIILVGCADLGRKAIKETNKLKEMIDKI